MKKKKNRHKKSKPQRREIFRPENNGHYNLLGKKSPLEITFQELRDRAMATPMLEADFDPEKVDMDRHSFVINYSNVYIMAIVVLAVFRDRKFHWFIQSQFVSKLSGKNVSLNLIGTLQRQELEFSKGEALGDAGIPEKAVELPRVDAYVWEVPFSEKDYEKLNDHYRILTSYDHHGENCECDFCDDARNSESYDDYLEGEAEKFNNYDPE